MTEAGRYPFLPEVYFWFVFEKDAHRYRIGWPRMKIEPLSPKAPEIAEQVVAALDAAKKDNRAAALDFISAMEELGYTFVGPSRFDFRSGTLFWQACTQLHLSRLANDCREAILAKRDCQAPGPSDPVWQEWTQATLQAGACSNGARLLGYASLEAFVNEVLYASFRDVYDEYEARDAADRTTPWASVPTKLARLLKELGVSRKTDWYRCIQKNAPIRRAIEHHKLDPAFTDPAGNLDSVAFEDGYGPEDVQTFLGAVQSAFQAVHDVDGVELPPTHMSPF